ncbi:MAG: ABC transporter ATP-binding protein [bacterium]
MRLKEISSTIKYYYKVLKYLIRPYKRQILALIILSILFSVIETAGVTAIAPFLSVLSNKEIILSNTCFKTIYQILGFTSIDSFFIIFGLVLIIFYIFRPIYNFFFNYVINKFINNFYHKTIVNVIKGHLHMPYKNFLNKNSSDLTKTIVAEVQQTTTTINDIIHIVSEMMVFLFIYTTIMIVNWKITLTLSAITGIFFLVFSLTITSIIKRQGNKAERNFKALFQRVSELFGNFKLIKFLNDDQILKGLSNVSSEYSDTKFKKEILAKLPQNILEAIGFLCLIGLIERALLKQANLQLLLPTLTIFALALYRILPSVSKNYYSFNHMVFCSKSLDRVYFDLVAQEEKAGYDQIDYYERIELKNVSFSYDNNQNAIEGVSFTIERLSKVAFAGESGSGKSTLADLIAGIYLPKEGEIRVDGVLLNERNTGTWRHKIGYIPQFIYLIDGTVAENITFGSDYDEARIIQALKKAKIYDFLQGKSGLKTRVGEGGIKMSGGQKQRIGIARALYLNPEILILDEPTSALDYETEKRIIDEIYESCKDKTIIIIAHRLNTIESCDWIYYLDNGKIVKRVRGKSKYETVNATKDISM